MQGSTRMLTLDSKDETAGEKKSTGFDSRALFPEFGPGTGPQADRLLQREASVVAACTGRVMTNHAGLIRAEHVLTARTKANRSRRHVVGNQRGAENRASAHTEGISALDEHRYGVTGEKFVNEASLRYRAESRRSACRCGSTKCTQSSGVADLRKQSRIANLSGVDRANRASR